MKKKWVKIKGTDDFWINEDGFVLNNKTGRIIGSKDKDGYYRCDIYYNDGKGRKKRSNHALCFEQFGKLPDDYSTKKYHIHHKDKNKNNNHISNLECENIQKHTSNHAKEKKGEETPFYGKHHTEETKRKLSKLHKGMKMSKETKKKISEILKIKFIGVNNPFYGKHHTEETKRKMREKRKGRRPNFIVSENEKFTIIIKMIQLTKQGVGVYKAFEILANEYPLKPLGIRKIWYRFQRNGKKIFA